jgi:SAM-dependent methyltransferase
MPDRFIYTVDDLLRTLDEVVAGTSGDWWDGFFASRAAPCPFLVDWPDESLAEWFADGLLSSGRVLELGCGNGRNAAYLASLGCRVDAVDFSAWAIERARERAAGPVTFQCCSIFDAVFAEGSYDLVYDSGCFHHLPPHRRRDYAGLVRRALKPGGHYGLVCFRPEGGSGLTDREVYERASLGGGLGYSQDRLRALWDTGPFRLRVLRQMKRAGAQGPWFGQDFLWALLAVNDGAGAAVRR